MQVDTYSRIRVCRRTGSVGYDARDADHVEEGWGRGSKCVPSVCLFGWVFSKPRCSAGIGWSMEASCSKILEGKLHYRLSLASYDMNTMCGVQRLRMRETWLEE